MKRPPPWLLRKMRVKKKKEIKKSFNCQLLNETDVLIERIRSRKPDEEAVAIMKTIGVEICSKTSQTVDIYEYLQLKKRILKNPSISVDFIPKRLIRHMTVSNETQEDIDWNRIPIRIKTAVFPFQREGIRRAIKQYNGRVLIADEMGLGKTIQAIGIASYYRDKWPCLILCPSFLKLNWKMEFLKWTDIAEENICIIKSGKQLVPKTAHIVIMSYGIVSKKLQELKAIKIQMVIADEAHYLKNKKAARTKSALDILQCASKAILLTGTPMANCAEECFTLLSALRPCHVGPWKDFVHRYCDAKRTLFGFDVSGKSNTRELSYLLKRSCMIRRLKCNVLEDLPNKLRSQIHVELSEVERKEITPLMQRLELINKLIFTLPPTSEECRKMIFERKALICKLFYLNDKAKGKVVSEILLEQLQQVRKIVVFCYHMSMMNSLENKLKLKKMSYMRIDGSTPTEKRHSNVIRFQDTRQDCRVALLSIGAANSGITLTAAHTVLFASLHWVPAELFQAEDRCHRIGQLHNFVDIRYVIAADTIDEKMFKKLNDKASITTSILNRDGVCDAGSLNAFQCKVVTFEREEILETEDE